MTITKKYLSKMGDFGEVLDRQHSFYGSPFVKAMIEGGGRYESSATGITFKIPSHFGFCYGVEKSIDMAFETVKRFPDRRIYLTHDVIHNPKVNQDLRDRKVTVLSRDEQGDLLLEDLNSEDIVVISAFGSKVRDVEKLKTKDGIVVDTTCGAIVLVWKRVEKYAKEGHTSVIHGIWNHEETQATASQAVRVGGHFVIVRNRREAEAIESYLRKRLPAKDFLSLFDRKTSAGFDPEKHLDKIGIASQTTMLMGETLELQEYLRGVYLGVFGEGETLRRFIKYDTICSATQERQDAIRNLLEEPLDLMLIIGGFNSSNTTHLSEIASLKYPTFHIRGPEDILSGTEIRHMRPENLETVTSSGWLKPSARLIGISTGASTPDLSIEQVIRKVESLMR